MISSLEHFNIVQHPLDLSAAVDTAAEAATSSFGGQAVSFPILIAGRLSAEGRVPTQEVYRDLNPLNVFLSPTAPYISHSLPLAFHEMIFPSH